MKFFLYLPVFALILTITAFEVDGQIPRLPSVRPKATPTPASRPQKPAVQSNSDAASAGQSEDYPKHFFFTTVAKATSDVLKAKDLTACIFGDNANPPNKNAFKKVVPTVGGQKGRVIDAGTCDVVVLVIKDAEAEKNLKRDNEGFVVYRIVGDDLDLLFKPEAGQHIAVGKMDFAGSQTLKKTEIIACGDSSLRNSFRPNPNTWKNWANEYMDAGRMAQLTPETSPLPRRCDVWIMTPELHKAFVKRFGDKHPLFNVSPGNAELTRR